jgi:ERF superfamily
VTDRDVAGSVGLMEALLNFQKDAPTLQKNGINPHFKAKYVTLDKLLEEVTPVLSKHGLVWLCRPVEGEKGPMLYYELAHVGSGQRINGSMPLLLKVNDPQGQGSALTYARRYSMMTVLGLVANEDDDGQRGSGQLKEAPARLLSDDERVRVLAELSDKGKNLALVLGALGIESSQELTNAHAFDIRAWLDGKKKL